MSLRIIKPGLLDTIQDLGRHGCQHLGINPGGVMDRFAAQFANAILGKDLNEPVIECHFPAAQIMFEKATILCICGGDFQPVLNGKEIPLNRAIAVSENSLLQFQKLKSGARCYVSCFHGIKADEWMRSCSTNLKTSAGGWQGRALSRYDQLDFRESRDLTFLTREKDFVVFPWKANEMIPRKMEVEFIIGSEWYELTNESKEKFQEHWFQISNDADRMGYRLSGPKLEVRESEELVSSAVNFGTVQLLPNGQLIILMADHQTTGGYPRIAHITSSDLPVLAQKKPNDAIRFKLIELASAEEKQAKQAHYLNEILTACAFRLDEYLNRSSASSSGEK